MSTIEARLAKLEAFVAHENHFSKLIVISGDRDMTADEKMALFAHEGVECGDNDLIIHLVRNFPGDTRTKAVPSLVSVAPLSNR